MAFPSPASDYTEHGLSLEEYLVEHREATYFLKATGNSMADFGIRDGDLLVVDRAIEPTDQNVVIAVIDGEFTVKQIRYTATAALLRTGDDQADIQVTPEQDITLWGVIRWSIHKI